MLNRVLYIVFLVFLLVMYSMTGNLIFFVIIGTNLIFYFLWIYVKKNPQSPWVKRVFESKCFSKSEAKPSPQDMSRKKLYNQALQFFISSTFLFLIFFLIVNRINNVMNLSRIFLVLIFAVLILFLLTLCSGLCLIFKALVAKDLFIPLEEEEDEEEKEKEEKTEEG